MTPSLTENCPIHTHLHNYMPHNTYTVCVGTVKAHFLQSHPCPHTYFQSTSFHPNSLWNKATFPACPGFLPCTSPSLAASPSCHSPNLCAQLVLNRSKNCFCTVVDVTQHQVQKCRLWKKERFRSVPTQAPSSFASAMKIVLLFCNTECQPRGTH